MDSYSISNDLSQTHVGSSYFPFHICSLNLHKTKVKTLQCLTVLTTDMDYYQAVSLPLSHNQYAELITLAPFYWGNQLVESPI